MERQYVGARYVPLFYEGNNGAQWEPNVYYDALTIVMWNSNSYTSKIPVPANVGNPQYNPKYWVNTGNFNAQLEQYRKDQKNYVIDTTNDFINQNFPAGVIVQTLGFNTINDKGAAQYLIGNLLQTNNIDSFTLANGNAAILIPDSELNALQLGCGTANATTNFQYAVNTYKEIVISSNIKINGVTLSKPILIKGISNNSILTITAPINIASDNVTLEKIWIAGVNTNGIQLSSPTNANHITNISFVDLIFTNCITCINSTTIAFCINITRCKFYESNFVAKTPALAEGEFNYNWNFVDCQAFTTNKLFTMKNAIFNCVNCTWDINSTECITLDQPSVINCQNCFFEMTTSLNPSTDSLIFSLSGTSNFNGCQFLENGNSNVFWIYGDNNTLQISLYSCYFIAYNASTKIGFVHPLSINIKAGGMRVLSCTRYASVINSSTQLTNQPYIQQKIAVNGIYTLPSNYDSVTQITGNNGVIVSQNNDNLIDEFIVVNDVLMKRINDINFKFLGSNLNKPTITSGTDAGSFYVKENRYVYVHIAVTGLTNETVKSVFQLPAGFRPSTTLNFVGFTGSALASNTITHFQINNDGTINVYSGTALYADICIPCTG